MEKNLYQREYQRKRKQEAIKQYGGKCHYCGENRWELLNFQTKEKPENKIQMYNWLKKKGWPKAKLICQNCNRLGCGRKAVKLGR
jgi:hypothetical protein